MTHPLAAIEPLEARIAPASAVGRALDLPDSATVDVSQVKFVALGIANNSAEGGLGGMPTGPDNDFIILSTGDATKAYAPRGNYPTHGTDFGKKGSDGELQHLQVTVPVAAGQTHVKFDFNFMTDEKPNDPEGPFDDTFFVGVTPSSGGAPETLVKMSVQDNLFRSDAPANAIYARQTGIYTADYRIPSGATSVTFDFYINDYPQPNQDTRYPNGDGTGDTAVAIDNFRFVSAPQTVWLNFEGGNLTSLLGPGSTLVVPAFQPADIKDNAADRATLINSIFNGVAAKFSDFDVDFVLSKPTSGSYEQIFIGGDGNQALTFSPAADSRLIKQYGANTNFKAYNGGGITFGRAQQDYGNTSLTSEGVVSSGAYANAGPPFSTDDLATLQKRLVVTIAHEATHALGMPHVDDSFDDNIMAQYSPRSPDGTFENELRAIVEVPAKDITSLNVHDYLTSVLGSSTASTFVNGPAINAALQQILKFFFPFALFDVDIGVVGGAVADTDNAGPLDETVQWLHFDQLQSGANELHIPNLGPGMKLVFSGSSQDNMPADVFSGSPTAGSMTFAEGMIPLFDSGTGELKTTIPIAMGDLNANQLAAVPNGVGLSPVLAAAGLQDIPTDGFMFTQADGDTVLVKLASKDGRGKIKLTADGDNIERIELEGTGAKDKLTISVSDGTVNLGGVTGFALGSLTAKTTDLNGAGLNFGNVVGSVTLHDVTAGADILIGGTFGTKTAITAHDVGDNTEISVDGTLKLTAARLGDGVINSSNLSALTVKGDKAGLTGDFKSDVNIVPGKILSAAEAKLNLLGKVTISGKTQGAHFVAPSNAGAFKTGTFEHSSIMLGFTPTTALDPLAGGVFAGEFKLGSFTASGIFDDSVLIAAQLGAIKLSNIDYVNPTTFGIAAKAGLLKNFSSIKVADGSFLFDPTALPQSKNNFTVKVI
ncbi:MAG: hypothetical protein QOE70_6463 [Chthoniobacter sp.]|jgi:hypothetical protein|nr:hypothetical protein [Chthoniobacter sp.]